MDQENISEQKQLDIPVDIYYNIYLNLPLESLIELKNVNMITNSIFNDDFFWREKTLIDYNLPSNYKKHFKSWRKEYFFLTIPNMKNIISEYPYLSYSYKVIKSDLKKFNGKLNGYPVQSILLVDEITPDGHDIQFVSIPEYKNASSHITKYGDVDPTYMDLNLENGTRLKKFCLTVNFCPNIKQFNQIVMIPENDHLTFPDLNYPDVFYNIYKIPEIAFLNLN